MKPWTRLDDALEAWFQAEAADPVPTGLAADVLGRTSRRRPRIRWLARIHQLPLAAGAAGSSATATRLAWLAAMLAALLLAIGVIAGSQLLRERPVITTIAPDPLLIRDSHQVFRLRDGRILVAGGSGGSQVLPDAALVDPWTGAVKAVSMVRDRDWGTAASPLADGRILIVGGSIGTGTQLAEVFDPRTDAFTPVGDMTSGRGTALVLKTFSPVAVPLADGRIVVVGGTTEQMASRTFPRPGDVFDPTTGSFTATPALPCVGSTDAGGNAGQEVRTADLLPDGRILLSCERWWNPRYGADVDADLPEQRFFAFDLETGEAEPVDIDAGLVARTMPLRDGSMLLWDVVGEDRLANGEKRDRYALARLDLSSLWVDPLDLEVSWGTAVDLLDDGHVVLAGGYEPGTGTPSDDVRLLDPCTGATTSVATLTSTRVGGTASQLDDEHLLLVGGQLGADLDMYEPAPPEVVAFDAATTSACTG